MNLFLVMWQVIFPTLHHYLKAKNSSNIHLKSYFISIDDICCRALDLPSLGKLWFFLKMLHKIFRLQKSKILLVMSLNQWFVVIPCDSHTNSQFSSLATKDDLRQTSSSVRDFLGKVLHWLTFQHLFPTKSTPTAASLSPFSSSSSI